MSVRVVFANRSGFDAPIGVVLAWLERGSCVKIFRRRNDGRISESFTNHEAKDLLRKNLHELRGKRLIAQVSETRQFPLYLRYGVDLMVQLDSSWHGRSVDHVVPYSGRQIAVRSHKPSRIMGQKTYSARAWIMSYHIQDQKSQSDLRNLLELRGKRLVAQSGFDAPIGVVMAWEERGSCLNLLRTRNRGQIFVTLMNYEAKHLLRKNPHELRGKRLVAQVSETHGFALYLRTGVDLMLHLKSSWHGKSVDHVLTYFGGEIAVGSQKNSRITRQKTCCASE
ncbi:uncharacterized protein G2W53_045227 [Senna tora]|uniref:Uncharacterized protein n=1 Tax=Senna tora TaxID=362788 RepID=A0A834SMD9_9FABA|nr:uncharacterized protein G2W53_045227 [Senna tora]